MRSPPERAARPRPHVGAAPLSAVATLPAIVGIASRVAAAAVPAAARTAAEQVRAMEEAALAAEDPEGRGELYGGW